MKRYEMQVHDVTGAGRDPEGIGLGPSGHERGVWTEGELQPYIIEALLVLLRGVAGLEDIRYDAPRGRFVFSRKSLISEGEGTSFAELSGLIESKGDEIRRVLRVGIIHRTVE